MYSYSVGANTIYWITFTDTTDPEIGSTSQVAQSYLYSQWIEKVNEALAPKCYTAEEYKFDGSNTSPENCKAVIKNLQCSSNDIVIFYYIGHGGRSLADNAKYPQMMLAQKYDEKCIPLTWVHEELKRKNARLTMTIGMCCNNFIEYLGPKDAIAFSSNRQEVNYNPTQEIKNIQKLFLGYTGNIILSSSSPGQNSWGYYVSSLGKHIDLFTYTFINEFHNYCIDSESPNWHLLLNRVRGQVHNTTSQNNSNGLLMQTPQYDVTIESDYFPECIYKRPKPKKQDQEPEDLIMAELKRNAASKVDVLNDYIQKIARKDLLLEDRMYYRKEALKLFINDGEEYKMHVLNKNGAYEVKTKKGVTMEVTSVNNKSKNTFLVKEYLEHLANLKYDKVYIESTEVANIKVSNLYKIKDNLYSCTCFFKQAFIGYKDGVPIYKDITEKKVECQVRIDYIPGEPMPDYVVKLGNIKALDTQPMGPNASKETIYKKIN